MFFLVAFLMHGGIGFGGSEFLVMIVTLILGITLTIVGIVMLSTKSSAQRKKDAEFEVLKRVHVQNKNPVTQSNVSNVSETESIKKPTLLNDDVLNQLEKLGKLKEQGVLTEEEFQQQKKKLLQ